MVGAMEIYKLLPTDACKECGYSSCMALAVALLNREKKLEDCPALLNPKYADKFKKLKEMLAPLEKASETGLIIHPEKCFGCGNCVVACPVNVAAEPTRCGIGLGPQGDRVILAVEDGVVKCMNVKECRRFGPNKVMCNACTVTCPSKAIEFV
jgi:4Fe-4S ferredoxin